MKEAESKRNFLNEFSLINKNKYTPEQTKSLYLGLLFELISSREVFEKNRDLENFVLKVYKQQYNDYLFRSRPYLASRLLKDISSEYDFLRMSASIKLIILFLKEKANEDNIKVVSDKENKKNRTNIEADTIGWFNSVNKGSNK
ncbi:hypothetical protein [Bacillus massilinigeriensis]|uniref:hypothetical protein n=1 Tax=Bacillus mediterraneensis TaxID=1805474 RepID=UPI0008F853DB|nr:hypothetical protein [Bacillus mediterraneensis]